ncbi:hypothetical protein [Kitasatospora sp. NPDC096140]|uniref:hypothetical protein n=1 Tax=Kitasatospora sp. NPDC096140 TaxID=3155425 RepID=UPI00331BD151
MHQNSSRVQLGVAVGPVGCWVGEVGGTGPVFGGGVLGAGFAGGSAGTGAADTVGPEGDVAVGAVPDGLGRVVVADGCGRAVAVAVVVAGAGAAGAPGVAAVCCEGDSAPAEAGATAPSELPPDSTTAASPQTTTPAADTASTVPRGLPCRRRAERRPDWRADRRGGADASAEPSPGGVGRGPAASPVVGSAARPQPGQESAPLRWRRQGVQ